jgi:hypothetical protein
MKRFVAAVIVTACTIAGAGTALAGEVNGNGDPVPGASNARSSCAFSGLEDGSEPGTTPGPGNTQNYGQDVKKGVSTPSEDGGADGPFEFDFLPPGVEIGCNAHLYPNVGE